MAANMRFYGTVTNNGAPVAATVKVASTTTSAGAFATTSPMSGRWNIATLSCSDGDTITLTVDGGTSMSATTILEKVIASRGVDLSCDIGAGSISALPRFA